MTPFRRVFVDTLTDPPRLGVETLPGEVWVLTNPTPEGKTYSPWALLRTVAQAGQVNLDRWERTDQ